jgi:hypothetical protein
VRGCGKRVVGHWMISRSHLWRRFFCLAKKTLVVAFSPFCPSVGAPPTAGAPPHLAAPPSFPLGLAVLSSHGSPSPRLPPPSRSPPRSKDREEEEHVELKGKRGSRRCSSPSLLAEFLGETLGMDEILVPPCNYVLLEVVDNGN